MVGAWQINLYQEVRAARGKSTILRDSLTLVDIAGAEKVGGDETGIKAAEGPRLNKGAFGFKGVCQAMAAGKVSSASPALPSFIVDTCFRGYSTRTSFHTLTPS